MVYASLLSTKIIGGETMRSLMTYRPRGLSLFDEMDRVFHSLTHDDSDLSYGEPRVDIRESENGYVLEAELPGLTEKDVDVKVEDNLLQISTKKNEKKEEKKNGYLMRERRFASYSRSFVLPREVKTEGIEASFKNGLLTLNIPKSEEAKPKQIEVKQA
jgi:HSP20 family protein